MFGGRRGVGGVGGAPGARVVAARGVFDFGDFGAQVPEHLCAVGACEDAGHVEDADVGKGAFVGRSGGGGLVAYLLEELWDAVAGADTQGGAEEGSAWCHGGGGDEGVARVGDQRVGLRLLLMCDWLYAPGVPDKMICFRTPRP